MSTLEQIINASDDDLTELKKFTRENLPETTCPRIDGLQKSLDSIERTLGRFNRYEDAESLADDVSSELSGFADELERLRKSNEALRDLSERWRDLAEKFHERMNEVDEFPVMSCSEDVSRGVGRAQGARVVGKKILI